MKCGCGNELILGEIHILHEMDNLSVCPECYQKYQAIKDKHVIEVKHGFTIWQKAMRAMKEGVAIETRQPIFANGADDPCAGCYNYKPGTICNCSIGGYKVTC